MSSFLFDHEYAAYRWFLVGFLLTFFGKVELGLLCLVFGAGCADGKSGGL